MYCKKCKKEFKIGKFCPLCGEELIEYDANEEEYDETLEQVKNKAIKAAKTYGGIAMNFGKALTNYAKKATDEFLENSQNGNLQKSVENKLEKLANIGGGTKKPVVSTEDYDVLKKKLQSLKEMKDEGLLSTEEYEEKRNILLNKGKPVKKKEKKEVKREEKIDKCPNCGEIINAFDLKCPTCGFELRNKKNSTRLEDFADKLDEIDDEYYDANENKKDVLDRLGLTNSEPKVSRAVVKKVEYIKNMSIPNTKEDIIEFMLLASSNINVELLGTNFLPTNDFINMKTTSEAWMSKMEQAYEKAAILLKDDISFERIKKLYDNKIGAIKKEKKKSFFLNPEAFLIYFCLFCFLMLFINSIIGGR